jgi:hypothetical protein
MKAERVIRKPNDSWAFRIEKINFVTSMFIDKNSLFTFVHKVDETGEIKKDSPLLMQFESKSKSDYLKLRNDLRDFLKNLAPNIKNKSKVENEIVIEAKQKLVVDISWYNPTYTYVAPPVQAYKAGAANAPAQISGYKKCGHVKPIIVLEILKSMNELILESTTYNTAGEEFWNYRLANDPSKLFKTSLKTKEFLYTDADNLYNPSNEMFRDVKIDSKGYGKGSIGLINFLGDNGLFPNALGHENKEDRSKRSVDYILKEIYPKVDPQLLANDDAKANHYKGETGIKIMNYPRLPFKQNTKIDEIKKYLVEERKLSTKLVNKLVEEGLLYSGHFVSNTMGESKLQFYKDQHFFHLTDKNGVISGAERLSFDLKTDLSTGNKYKKIAKRNTHPVRGNAFRLLSKNNNPEGTFIGEAVIDVLSAYELFSIAGLDANNFNYLSMQSCSNLNGFLSTNAGFGFELNEMNRVNGEFFGVKVKQSKEKIAPAKIESYNNNLNKYEYFFINTGSDKCNEIINKIPVANKILGRDIKVINKSKRDDYIDYNSYDREKSMFMDETSFDQFFEANKVIFEYDNETNKYRTMMLIEKEEPQKITPEVKNQVHSLLMKHFKTTTLMFGLDNDEAGLKFRQTLGNLGAALGLKSVDMYPDVIKGASEKDPKVDVNDVLKMYHKLKDAGKVEEGLTIVENYVKKLVPTLNLVKKNKPITNKP